MSAMTVPVEPAPDGARPLRRKPRAPTIYDVAELAQVSPSAVSRALSKPGRLSAKTEKKILDAAAELGYQLNPMARALPTGRTRILGLVVSDITNPMFFNAIRGAEQAASAAGYILTLTESRESAEIESITARRLMPSVDGMLLVASRLSDEEVVDLSRVKPVVVMNREIEDVPSILPDLRPGIDAALEHLADLGHRSVCFLSGPTSSWMSAHRWSTLLDKAVALGMSIVEIGPGEPTVEGGRSAFPRVRASGATAVFAYNDLMGIGLMLEAQERRMPVPATFSIIGFDDIFGSSFTSPPLSTIRTPLGDMGRRAIEVLLANLDAHPSDGADAVERSESTEFVRRASTAEAPVR
jgi:LacI family transcriptional regulator